MKANDAVLEGAIIVFAGIVVWYLTTSPKTVTVQSAPLGIVLPWQNVKQNNGAPPAAQAQVPDNVTKYLPDSTPGTSILGSFLNTINPLNVPIKGVQAVGDVVGWLSSFTYPGA
jgi:hypothetical protein